MHVQSSHHAQSSCIIHRARLRGHIGSPLPPVAYPPSWHQPWGCRAASVDEPSEVAAETAVRVGWDPSGLLPPLEQIGSTDHFARRARQKQLQQQQQVSTVTTEIAAADHEAEHHVAAVGAPAQAYSQAVRPPQVATKQKQQGPAQQQQQQQQPHSAQQPSSTGASSAGVQEPAAAQPLYAAVPFIARDPYERVPAKWLNQGGIPASDAAAYDRPALVAKLAEKFVPIDLDFPGLRIVNFDPAIFTVDGFLTSEECSSWQEHALESGGSWTLLCLCHL